MIKDNVLGSWSRRLIHDLANPLGSLSMGLSMIRDASMQEDALVLAEKSLEKIKSSLVFFRCLHHKDTPPTWAHLWPAVRDYGQTRSFEFLDHVRDGDVLDPVIRAFFPAFCLFWIERVSASGQRSLVTRVEQEGERKIFLKVDQGDVSAANFEFQRHGAWEDMQDLGSLLLLHLYQNSSHQPHLHWEKGTQTLLMELKS